MFNKGDIVYWVSTDVYQSTYPRYIIKWGVVDIDFPYYTCVDLYDVSDNMVIDGIPIQDYVCDKHYKKLPKGWSYDTRLIDITYSNQPIEVRQLNIADPKGLKKAIDNGWLVAIKDKANWIPYCEIDAKQGWRVTKEYKSIQKTSTIEHSGLYMVYDEAKEERDRRVAEFERISALTDEEWSREKIEDTIGFWARLHGIEYDSVRVQNARKFLLNLDHIEDVEVRSYMGRIQYKYWKKTKWIDVEP